MLTYLDPFVETETGFSESAGSICKNWNRFCETGKTRPQRGFAVETVHKDGVGYGRHKVPLRICWIIVLRWNLSKHLMHDSVNVQYSIVHITFHVNNNICIVYYQPWRTTTRLYGLGLPGDLPVWTLLLQRTNEAISHGFNLKRSNGGDLGGICVYWSWQNHCQNVLLC